METWKNRKSYAWVTSSQGKAEELAICINIYSKISDGSQQNSKDTVCTP